MRKLDLGAPSLLGVGPTLPNDILDMHDRYLAIFKVDKAWFV